MKIREIFAMPHLTRYLLDNEIIISCYDIEYGQYSGTYIYSIFEPGSIANIDNKDILQEMREHTTADPQKVRIRVEKIKKIRDIWADHDRYAGLTFIEFLEKIGETL